MTLTAVVLAASFQAGVPTLQAVPDPQEDFCVDCCNLYCAAAPEVSVSHFLPPQERMRYDAARAEDGLPSTAWVVPGGGGEWVQFAFLPGEGQFLLPTLGVDVLYLLNGYGKSLELWRQHSRVSEMDLLVDGKLLAHVRLLDSREAQRVALPKIPLHPGLTLRFVIRSLFRGSKFDETAISEIRVDGYGHH